MIKREITYEDFDGNKHTDVFYFHLNEVELTEIEVDYEGGVQAVFSRATQTGNNKEAFELIQRFMLSAYGLKEPDGKGFTKNEAITQQFKNSFAYPALYKELTSSDELAARFITGIMPKDFVPEDTTLEDLMKPKSNQVVVNLPPGPLPTKE